MKKISIKTIEFFENIGLLIISIATLIAFGFELYSMVQNRIVTLADLLLLFIYLEVFAMVSNYIQSGKLPVRMPLYIAIVALARYLILDMKNMDTYRMMGVGGTVLLIAITVLIIRYGHCKYSYDEKSKN